MGVIFAVVGMTGSGKSEVTSILEKKGFQKIRFGQITMDILRVKNLEVNEKNERMVRENLRKEHGMASYAILNIPKIKGLSKIGDVVLDGLYSWEEYTILKENFPEMKVIAVYSSPKTRYERLSRRSERSLTIEEASSRDKSEIENLHKAGPIAMADYNINNESNLEQLKNQIDKVLKI
jgi:dephospho-CoA kinase